MSIVSQRFQNASADLGVADGSSVSARLSSEVLSPALAEGGRSAVVSCVAVGSGCSGSVASGGSLGTVGKTSSKASGSGKFSAQSSVNFLRRFWLQSAARDLLPRESVSSCLRRVIPIRAGVDVLYAPAVQAAHYSGLMVCKSVWLCPVCSAKISERRREDLTLGLQNFYAAKGVKRVLLVTFTLSHHKNDNLSTVKRALIKARKLLVSGRWAKQFAAEHHIIGMVRSLEVTYGDNGWHPHMHVLYFFDQEIAIIPFEENIKARWGQCVAAAGSFASWDYGCDVRYSDKEVANYVAKFGRQPEWKENDQVLSADKWSISHEVTKGPSKVSKNGGSTPLQLLSDFSYGNSVSGALFVQYAMNFKGERQLVYSPGLRDRLGLDVEKTDDELAVEQSEVAIILAQLNREQWRIVVGNDARGELLQVASSGDSVSLGVFLRSIGIVL